VDPTTGILGGVESVATDGLLILDVGDVVILWGINGDPVGDDGGWEVTAVGAFPIPVIFSVNGYDCFSGTVGDGVTVESDDGFNATFVVPPLPMGTYDVVVRKADGTGSPVTLISGLEIIHRAFTTDLYALRAHLPPPRAVGPYAVQDEE